MAGRRKTDPWKSDSFNFLEPSVEETLLSSVKLLGSAWKYVKKLEDFLAGKSESHSKIIEMLEEHARTKPPAI
jgi:hypothetical protein